MRVRSPPARKRCEPRVRAFDGPAQQRLFKSKGAGQIPGRTDFSTILAIGYIFKRNIGESLANAEDLTCDCSGSEAMLETEEAAFFL